MRTYKRGAVPTEEVMAAVSIRLAEWSFCVSEYRIALAPTMRRMLRMMR